MAPTGLDIKRNIVQLAQIKGLKQSDFVDAGIGSTTVKSIFRMKSAETPDLDTVNKFAAVLGVETYIIYMTSPHSDEPDEEKKEFLAEIDMAYNYISPKHRQMITEMCRLMMKPD